MELSESLKEIIRDCISRLFDPEYAAEFDGMNPKEFVSSFLEDPFDPEASIEDTYLEDDNFRDELSRELGFDLLEPEDEEQEATADEILAECREYALEFLEEKYREEFGEFNESLANKFSPGLTRKLNCDDNPKITL